MLPETKTAPTTDIDTETGSHDKYKHIVLEGFNVAPTDQESGSAFIPTGNSVVEGFIMGASVTALCGKTWVPNDNPDKFPLCPACKDIAFERWGKVFE